MGLAGLAASGVTIAALTVVDSVRKRNQVTGASRALPAQLPVDKGAVTIYTKGRALYDDMLAAIDGAVDRIYFETYIWKDDRVGRRFETPSSGPPSAASTSSAPTTSSATSW